MSCLEAPPLAIYAHMPWCVRKCPYCDFNSHVAPNALPGDRYVEWLLADLRHDAVHVANRDVSSIFFGGGTPSLFSAESIARFLTGVRGCVSVVPDVEVTLEANPGTIEHGRFAAYREAGVTRISLGVQSFNDNQLKVLGRIHGKREVLAAVGELRTAGIDNFNLDLMYGLPNQTLAEALEDVSCAVALAPTHISHYQLTMEPGTAFFHRPPPLPNDDEIWQMQIECQRHLRSAGYEQYEVSAYAQSTFTCRHNLNYWQFGDYLGLGAGAHGKWTDLKTGLVWRTERCRQPREYLAQVDANARTTRTAVPTGELPFEFMLNALRLNEGFSIAQFESRTGLTHAAIVKPLAEATKRGLIESCAADRWRATVLGQRFLNDLQSLFLADLQSTTAQLVPA